MRVGKENMLEDGIIDSTDELHVYSILKCNAAIDIPSKN